MKVRILNYALFLVLVVILVVLFYQVSFTGNLAIIADELLPEGEYVQASARLDDGKLYLISDCNALIMSIGEEQEISINIGLHNVSGPRPLTHDLIKDAFDLFGVEVIMARIESLEDSTYFARLFLQQGNKILNLDSRPSDAVAIAVRERKPIFVKKTLMESEGKKIC